MVPWTTGRRLEPTRYYWEHIQFRVEKRELIEDKRPVILFPLCRLGWRLLFAVWVWFIRSDCVCFLPDNPVTLTVEESLSSRDGSPPLVEESAATSDVDDADDVDDANRWV